jgi:hypothetical protein
MILIKIIRNMIGPRIKKAGMKIILSEQKAYFMNKINK